MCGRRPAHEETHAIDCELYWPSFKHAVASPSLDPPRLRSHPASSPPHDKESPGCTSLRGRAPHRYLQNPRVPVSHMPGSVPLWSDHLAWCSKPAGPRQRRARKASARATAARQQLGTMWPNVVSSLRKLEDESQDLHKSASENQATSKKS